MAISLYSVLYLILKRSTISEYQKFILWFEYGCKIHIRAVFTLDDVATGDCVLVSCWRLPPCW